MLRVRRFCSQAAAALEAPNTPATGGKSSLRPGGLRPSEIVAYLDEYIIGQKDAKRAVANALRNRWRRQQLPEEIRREIQPRNILMVGSTGIGKTEIARRIAQLTSAPFLKVEETKYTEVGYHGADVDTCVKDLVAVAMKKQRHLLEEEFREIAVKQVEDQLLVAVIGNLSNPADHETWMKHLRGGLLDDKTITVDVPNVAGAGDAGANLPEGFFFDPKGSGSGAFKVLGGGGGRASEKRRLTVKEARSRLMQVAFDKLINQELIMQRALTAVEQEGIIFIDEIDKICSRAGTTYGVDASGEGVQRDLLPIIEGCEVNVAKFGTVKTDHILFICAGAFHAVKPSDMLPELQGRLPVRVSLAPLTEADFVRILTEPKNNFLRQQTALMMTDGVNVVFPDETVREIAKVTFEINTHVENIGARRLHTVIEKVMEDISFCAADGTATEVVVTAENVRKAVGDLLKKTDLHRFIL